MHSPLPRSFFNRNTITVARALLGQKLIRLDPKTNTLVGGLIIEVEAYLGPHDKAAHTYNHHRTPRVETMWGPPGHAYVYFTYGMHHCMNVTTRPADTPQAVLIRALAPTDNLSLMYTRRKKAKRDRDLCSGPAKLTQALGIDLTHGNTDLTTPPTPYSPLCILQIRKRAYPSSHIVATPRIGVAYAEEWAPKPLRFYLRHSQHLTTP
ncbi:DNA-3-methyladenine glycosylase [Poriferisphaera sp. WC338]|uniref:DNA-3-methyladenine glycosylase n=1 Tax=Poriferisphaera sp. WC338 TaxID=3425129 RepID=UPI003D818006